jgi:transcriptional regulator with XRE-family HTH domain
VIRFDLVTDKRRVDKSPERNSRLAGFTSELGRLAKTARTSAGFSRKQLSLLGLAPSLIQRIEGGDPRVTVGELWTYATKLGVRATHLVPAEHMPFEELDERATARSARLQFLRRLRRRKLPPPRPMRELMRVRSASPLATESELIEKDPVVEVAWPEAVTAAERRIDESLASKLLQETAALARTLEAFLMADLELARDIGSFANPGSAWLHHPHHDHDLSRALQQLAGHVQGYVAAAGPSSIILGAFGDDTSLQAP